MITLIRKLVLAGDYVLVSSGCNAALWVMYWEWMILARFECPSHHMVSDERLKVEVKPWERARGVG